MSKPQDQQTREFLRDLPPPASIVATGGATTPLHPAVIATILAFFIAGVLGGLIAAPIALRRLSRDGGKGRSIAMVILVLSIAGLVAVVSLLVVSLVLGARNQ